MSRSITGSPNALESSAGPARLEDALFLASGLAWAAGVIHLEVAIPHFSEFALFGAFFVCLGIAQFLLGIAIYRRPMRGVLLVGAGISLAVAGLWVASRTVGLPIGPEPWTAEPVGVLDSLATADELLLALIVAWRLGGAGAGGLRRGVGYATTVTGSFLIMLNAAALTLGSGHVH
jgi:hypothetical protein